MSEILIAFYCDFFFLFCDKNKSKSDDMTTIVCIYGTSSYVYLYLIFSPLHFHVHKYWMNKQTVQKKHNRLASFDSKKFHDSDDGSNEWNSKYTFNLRHCALSIQILCLFCTHFACHFCCFIYCIKTKSISLKRFMRLSTRTNLVFRPWKNLVNKWIIVFRLHFSS